MIDFLKLFVHVLVSPFKTQAQLEAEIVLLRHQLNVLRRRVPSKPKLAVADRLLFVWLYRLFPSVLNAVTIVQPETIIRWHRNGFRLYWRWKSRSRGGRPKVPIEIRRLIREMSLANRLWGAPRIHGELLKLGIEVAQSTVAKYMARSGRGRSQTWKTFLHNHAVRHRRHGLPGRADGRLQVALRFGHSQASAPAADITQRDGQSNGGVDRSPNHRCLPLERSAGLSHPGSRRVLRSSGHQASCCDGHTRSPDGRAVTLAERACGETDRLDPPANASITSSSSARAICAGSLRPTSAITTNSERICPWRRIRRPSTDPTARPARRAAILGGLHHQYCRM